MRAGESRWSRSQPAVVAAVGLADMAADLMYAHATHAGLLPVVSILSSLYPVATVLLHAGSTTSISLAPTRRDLRDVPRRHLS
jgi:hypothetical protein